MSNTPHTPRVRLSRRPQLRAPWALGGTLEASVADGSWDRDDASAQRYVARLTSPRSLQALARGLRKAIDDTPPAGGFGIRITGASVDDARARAACLALAETLETTSAAHPAAVVRTVRFLRDPDSALQGPAVQRLIEDATALRLALALGRRS